MSQPKPAQDWDPLSPEYVEDPRAVWQRLHASCPVAYSDQFGGFWALFKHADIEQAAGDIATFSSAERFSIPSFSIDGVEWRPLQSDPPEHGQFRQVIRPLFQASRLKTFEAPLRAMTNELIDKFIDRGQADLAAELCIPLPAAALCLLLGRPLDDWTMLKEWAVRMIDTGRMGDLDGLVAVYGEMMGYAEQWKKEVAAKGTAAEGDGQDLMMRMLSAGIEGRGMTDSEIAGMFVLTITAGHETTANTLANAMHYLAANPSARRYLTGDPARIPRAVEELIRFCSPTQHLARTTTREVAIGGRTIPAGQPVALMWTAGNMDGEKYENPDTCDFARDARGNLTFGSGIHRCVGEFLARMEIRIVLEEFLRRIPDFELDGPGEPAGWNSIGFYRLPARFTAQLG
ncbi:MAG TPA: cytochrome P450 [Streptosporangiaceae bacterium]|jgi:hypothetical protein